jgi:hypothetical protein
MSLTLLTDPPTFLVRPGAPQPHTAEDIVQISFRLTGGTTVRLVPMFLGAEPAERFRLSLGEKGEGVTTHQPKDFQGLEGLLVDLRKGGTTHVNFNAELDRPNPIPIDEVIHSLRSRP